MTVQTLHYSPFDILHASEETWDNLLHVRQIAAKESNPFDPAPPNEVLRKSLEVLPENPDYDFQVFFVQADTESTRPLGMFFLAIARPTGENYAENKHAAFIEIYILPDHRRQGIGTQVLNHLANLAQAADVTVLQTSSNTDYGNAFAEKHRAEVGLNTRVSRLTLAHIDWAQIESWYQEGKTNNPTVSLEQFDGLIQDSELEAYSHLYSEVLNQQPLGELEGVEGIITAERMQQTLAEFEAQGILWTTFISREADGAISGLTELLYNPKRPHRARQELTGVQAQYRGRGLGRYLKAAMLLHVRERYPDLEYIETGNANSNAAMLAINEKLGFKLYKQNTLYKFFVHRILS